MDGNGRRAAIVGGSLGGLTVANLLRDDGWDVTIHERSAIPLDGRGAGIVVHEASVRYLVERSGFSLDTISCPATAVRYFSPNGDVVYEAPSQYRFTAWNTMYQALLSTIADQYHLGHDVTGVEQSGDDEVTLKLADGSLDTAELVVAADGFDSTVRNAICGDVHSTYGGYVGWRGLVSESDLTDDTFALLADAISYCVIPGSHIVAYPIPAADGSLEIGSRLVNYVWYRNVEAGSALDELMTGTDGDRRAVSLHPGMVQQHYIDELREAAESLAPPLTETVQRTAEPFLQTIVDIETPRMVSGNIALLGDGAFAARPHAAAGTAKAAEDGWRLVAELAAHDSIGAALAAWESTQLALGQQLVARARDLGERSQKHNSWVPGDPELAFGLYGPGN